MPLFAARKDLGVRSLIVKMVNNNCPELKALMEGPRNDSRVNLVVVVMVIPLEKRRLAVEGAFTAITKEFSSTGVGVVLDHPCALEQAVLGFRFEGEMHFVRARARHLNPLGGGFSQLGFQMSEVVTVHDYPELESMSF
jgi:hypothetical protein